MCFSTQRKGKPEHKKENGRKRENKRFQWFNIISMNKKALFHFRAFSTGWCMDFVSVYVKNANEGSLFYTNIYFLWFIHKCYLYIRVAWELHNGIHDEKIGEIEITMGGKNGKTNYLNLLSKAHENGMKFFFSWENILCTVHTMDGCCDIICGERRIRKFEKKIIF